MKKSHIDTFRVLADLRFAYFIFVYHITIFIRKAGIKRKYTKRTILIAFFIDLAKPIRHILVKCFINNFLKREQNKSHISKREQSEILFRIRLPASVHEITMVKVYSNYDERYYRCFPIALLKIKVSSIENISCCYTLYDKSRRPNPKHCQIVTEHDYRACLKMNKEKYLKINVNLKTPTFGISTSYSRINYRHTVVSCSYSCSIEIRAIHCHK